MSAQFLAQFTEQERTLPTGDVITELPFTAPWMSAFGSCFINITGLRRDASGKIDCQLGGEDGEPYDNGAQWHPIDCFPDEWPD